MDKIQSPNKNLSLMQDWKPDEVMILQLARLFIWKLRPAAVGKAAPPP